MAERSGIRRDRTRGTSSPDGAPIRANSGKSEQEQPRQAPPRVFEKDRPREPRRAADETSRPQQSARGEPRADHVTKLEKRPKRERQPEPVGVGFADKIPAFMRKPVRPAKAANE
jgi:hypothetical protein